MKKCLLAILLFLCCCFSIKGQTFYQVMGTPAMREGGSIVIASPDGNVIVGGYRGDSALVMKMSPTGGVIWARTFPPVGPNNSIWHLDISPDGFIVGTGGLLNTAVYPIDGFYFKMNLAGGLQWMKREAHAVGIYFTRIIPHSASQYRLVIDYLYPNGNWYDIALVEVDALTGNVLSQTPRYNLAPTPYIDDALGAAAVSGGGTVISGRVYVTGAPVSGSRPMLFRLSNANAPLWAKYYFYPSNVSARIYGKEVNQVGNQFICSYYGDHFGTSTNYTFGLFATDLNGNPLWGRDFNIPLSAADHFYREIRLPGGLVMVGSFLDGTNRDMFLVKADFQGNLIWSRRLGTATATESAYFQAYMGAYALGSLWVTGTTTTGGNEDMFVARIDTHGNMACNVIAPLTVNTYTFSPSQTNLPITPTAESLPLTNVSANVSGNFPNTCSQLSVNLGPDISTCNSVQLTPGNGAGWQYLWQNGSTASTFTATTSGTYHVTVTVGCCQVADTVNVTFTPPPVVNLGPDQNLCAGQALTLDAGNPGATFLWNNNFTGQSQPGGPGLWWVEVTMNGCSSRDTVMINSIPSPVVNLGPDQNLCAGQTLTLDAGNAGATYLWSNNFTGQSQSVGPGIYWVQVTANGCTGSDTVTINSIPNLVVNLGPDQNLCAGQTLTLDAGNAGATYLWSNNFTGQSQSVGPGIYWVQVTANGCTGSDTVMINSIPNPVVNLGPDQNLCAGQTLTLDAGKAGAAFLWSNNFTGQSQSVAPGMWWVQVTANGCSSRDTVMINSIPSPVVNLGPDQNLCAGQTLTLNAGNAGATYLWSNNFTGQSQSVGPGIYWVQVTANGCTGSDTVMINSIPNPVVNLGPDQTLCAGQTLTLDAGNPGATFLWSNNFTGQSQSVAPGMWWVQVTANGCSSSDTVMINSIPSPVVNLGPDQNLCDGETLTLDAGNPGATYLWSNNFTGQSQTLPPGTYSVQVSINGCTASDAIVLSLIPPFDFSLGPDTSVCGSSLSLDGPPGGLSYLWSTGETTSQIAVTESGDYALTAIAECGPVSDTIHVELGGVISGPFIPNAFTPNGDWLNEDFCITGIFPDAGFSVRIFDRWGALIWESFNPAECWKGDYGGEPVQEGVYAFVLQVPLCDGKMRRIAGSVTLIR